MKKADIFVRIATQGLIGFGAAPGTVATLMVMPLAYFLGTLGLTTQYYALLCVLFLLCGAYIIHRALPAFNNGDPAAIVIDEMVCFLCVFIGISVTMPSLIIGFGLFRFFDIIKPFGITRLEELPGVQGVIYDDLAAAVLSNVILRALMYAHLL